MREDRAGDHFAHGLASVVAVEIPQVYFAVRWTRSVLLHGARRGQTASSSGGEAGVFYCVCFSGEKLRMRYILFSTDTGAQVT
jgi:hypothetical protein